MRLCVGLGLLVSVWEGVVVVVVVSGVSMQVATAVLSEKVHYCM